MDYEKMVEIREDAEEKKKKTGRRLKLWAGLAAFIALMFAFVFVWNFVAGLLNREPEPEPEPEIITVSTLEKIINVSELSTFKAVYNGIAEVRGDDGKVDYYVSYDAAVDAGMDFENLKISVDNQKKEVTIAMPNVYITDVNVDISSLDYIFVDDKANTSSVSQAAFKACEEDVKTEVSTQDQIFTLAEQNAENILTALIKPIIEQLDAEYRLIIM